VAADCSVYRQGYGCIKKHNTQNFINKENTHTKELKFSGVVKKIRNEDLNCIQKLCLTKHGCHPYR
jgi:hypothetical protein